MLERTDTIQEESGITHVEADTIQEELVTIHVESDTIQEELPQTTKRRTACMQSASHLFFQNSNHPTINMHIFAPHHNRFVRRVLRH